MRGYFAIGVEGLSKPMNAGTLFRSAHAFGASFVFTIGGVWSSGEARLSDTADSASEVPHYHFGGVDELRLPDRCALVGIELMADSVELPSFRHPRSAAYVLGPERGSLSPELVARCDHVIRIPTSFCINVAVAGSIVMYDRQISLGRFAERPVAPGGPLAPPPAHVHGKQIIRNPEQNPASISGKSASPAVEAAAPAEWPRKVGKPARGR